MSLLRLQSDYQHFICSSLWTVILALLTIVFLPTSSSQTQIALSEREAGVFASFQKSVALIREKTPKLDFSVADRATANEALDSISSDVDFIREVATKRSQAQMPEEYLRSLSSDASLLRAIADAEPRNNLTPRRVLSVLHEVASDLNIKAAYIHSSRSTALRLVQVVVHTVKNNKELGGYEVWYVPRGWADEPRAFSRFGRLSSPTYTDLAPGNYLIWVQKGQ